MSTNLIIKHLIFLWQVNTCWVLPIFGWKIRQISFKRKWQNQLLQKAAFHSQANGVLRGYVSFIVYKSTYRDSIYIYIYILHQNSIWPYRHKHINLMVNVGRPWTHMTQDLQNYAILFCFHSYVAPHALFFSQPLPLPFNLNLFTVTSLKKRCSFLWHFKPYSMFSN